MDAQGYAIDIELISRKLNGDCERGEKGEITHSDFIRKQPIFTISVLLMGKYQHSNKKDEILDFIKKYYSYVDSSIDEIIEKESNIMVKIIAEFNVLIQGGYCE